ncbi:hypothetical protein [Phenylobacterium sp. J367]|uniref:hypothetical protein n=1 Tax=Phenylobacterium sp. J367 TaxID=2898435 RepID=UPI0021508731|nr:hypothetical protein [Phenylobacterium sp. J367]MCR5880194.1 hypothetical protein [Phenylobacterium sp. J367]
MLFRETEYARPTPTQYALLGEAVVDWSIIDLLVESLLARLVRAPDFPMLAITKRLGADARNAALQALAEMHEQRYGGRALPSEAVAKVALIRKRLEALKPFRNRVAHWIWMRQSDDALFGTPMVGRVPKRGRDEGMVMTNAELRAHLDELPSLAALIEAALQAPPEVDERSLLS